MEEGGDGSFQKGGHPPQARSINSSLKDSRERSQRWTEFSVNPCEFREGELIELPLLLLRASQVALTVKNLPASAGDVRDAGWIPGWGRSPGGGHGNPLQYSCLENPMDYSPQVFFVTKSRTQLKQLSTYTSHAVLLKLKIPALAYLTLQNVVHWATFISLLFLAGPLSMQDLSSLTRDESHASCSGSVGS